MTVGLIAGYQQAEDIVASGKADMICLGARRMWDPRWAWHAAGRARRRSALRAATMAGHPRCVRSCSRRAHAQAGASDGDPAFELSLLMNRSAKAANLLNLKCDVSLVG